MTSQSSVHSPAKPASSRPLPHNPRPLPSRSTALLRTEQAFTELGHRLTCGRRSPWQQQSYSSPQLFDSLQLNKQPAAVSHGERACYQHRSPRRCRESAGSPAQAPRLSCSCAGSAPDSCKPVQPAAYIPHGPDSFAECPRRQQAGVHGPGQLVGGVSACAPTAREPFLSERALPTVPAKRQTGTSAFMCLLRMKEARGTCVVPTLSWFALHASASRGLVACMASDGAPGAA